MLESYLINHCSPALGKLKIANLISIKSKDKSLFQEIEYWNSVLNQYDIYLRILESRENSILLYVFQLEGVLGLLDNDGTKEFLRDLGYPADDVMRCLLHLSDRLSKSRGFPHEIGIFLGYPLKDVDAYIKDKGKNPALTGYWQVYYHANKARKIFGEYSNCTNYFKVLHNRGVKLQEIISNYSQRRLA